MIRKIIVGALIATAAMFSVACWEEVFGYTCDGLGTCSSPKICCDYTYSGGDCYYVAEGHTFYCDYYDCYDAAYDMGSYCGSDTCGGSYTCDDPYFCYDGGDWYYQVGSTYFWCDGYYCSDAADDLAYYCY